MKLSKGKIILIALVLYFVIFAIINVKKEKNTNKEILEKVTYVEKGKYDKKNDGKLVLVSGKATSDQLVSFDELDDSFGTIRIKRKVEDFVKYHNEANDKQEYKWQERTESYEKDDDNFLTSIVSDEKIADVKIGDYELDKKGLELIPADSYYSKQEKIGDLITTGIDYSRDPYEEDLQEGDIRITYKYYDLEKHPYLSILAVQDGHSFKPYKLDKKNEVYQLFVGKIDNEDKLTKQLKTNVKKTIKGKFLFILLILGIGIFLIADNKKNTTSK